MTILLRPTLLLTIIFSFLAPIVLVGAILLTVSLIGLIPGFQGIGDAIDTQILQFLATFGTGVPLHGIFTISLTCSFVAVLFDTYAFFREKNFHKDF
jgi:hypothetical protein